MCCRKLTRVFIPIIIMGIVLSGCSSEVFEPIVRIDNGTSYFCEYTSERTDDEYVVSGTIYQAGNYENTILIDVAASEKEAAEIMGTMKRKKGNIQLVYTAPDGTETLIADGDDKTFDTMIELSEGKGTISFIGNEKNAIYSFAVSIAAGEQVVFGTGEASESAVDREDELPELSELPSIPEMPESASAIPDIPESISDAEVSDGQDNFFPEIADNWPESISCASNGMNAEPLCFDIEIDKPMTLSISCDTESGKMSMKIINSREKVYFDEENIQTEDFTVEIDETGTYTVYIQAEKLFGGFTIKPAE